MCRVTHHEITQPVLPDKAQQGNAKQCSLGRGNQSFRVMDETHQKQDTCDSCNDKTMTFKTATSICSRNRESNGHMTNTQRATMRINVRITPNTQGDASASHHHKHCHVRSGGRELLALTSASPPFMHLTRWPTTNATRSTAAV